MDWRWKYPWKVPNVELVFWQSSICVMASRLVATGDKPRLSSCDSLPKQSRRRAVLWERIGGANPLPADKLRLRPRKPPGPHLRFPPRPVGLPTAPSPVPDGTGPLVPEETSVSSGEGGTQGTPPRLESAPLPERALQTREAPPSSSTDARHRPSCQLDSERRQARRKRVGNGQVGEATASKQKGTLAHARKERGQACPREEPFPEKKRAAFLQGNRKKRETRKLCLTSAGEILCRSPGPHPGGQTLTLPGVATPRKAGPGRPGPIGRPARFLLSVVTGGSRVPARDARRLSACLGPGPGCPGTCPRARAPARARRSGSRARSVPAFWESNRGRVAHPACPVFRGLVRSGRAVERRLPVPSLLLRAGRPSGDLTLGPTSHS